MSDIFWISRVRRDTTSGHFKYNLGMTKQTNTNAAGTISLGGQLTVNRIGFGAMQLQATVFGDLPRTVRVRLLCCEKQSSWASISSTLPIRMGRMSAKN